jgi:hypothetical protein
VSHHTSSCPHENKNRRAISSTSGSSSFLLIELKPKVTDSGEARLSLARSTDDRRVSFADAATIVDKIALIAKKDWNLDFILVASHDALPEEVKAAIAENYGKNTKAKGVVHHCFSKIIGIYFSCWLSFVSCRTIVKNVAGQP